MKHAKSRITRRYARRRRRKPAVFLPALLAAGILLYLALAMGAGAWAHDLLFGKETAGEDELMDAETTQAPAATGEITETVSFPSVEGSILCVKADAPEETAVQYRKRGGAGFILAQEDGTDAVALALYENQSACSSVAEKLVHEENTRAFVRDICTDAVDLRITALPQRIDGLRDVFSVWQQTVQLTCALWQDADSGLASAQQAVSRIKAQRDKLLAASENAFGEALLSGRSDALDSFYRVVCATLEEMDALIANPTENILEVSAGIKYTGIRALTEYQSCIESLKLDLT